jgi:tetratricopeptide (TPR) repeat protein
VPSRPEASHGVTRRAPDVLSPSVQGHLILFAVVVIIVPLPAAASTESRYLVIEGIDALTKREYHAALDKFDKAAQTDPNDAEAVFFQGVALNRLGRAGQALERLRKARDLGSTHAELPFELGWSLLNARRFKDAIEELERYEQASPGRGQTSEFLGRAYYALAQYDKAEALLQDALRRDPDLAPTVRVFLALVAKERGDQGAIRRQLRSLLEDSPDSPLARRLQERVEEADRAAALAERPFLLSLFAGGGYNDNVIALGKGINLPSDISRQGAGFFQSSLDGSYAKRVGQSDIVVVGYRFLSTVYEGLSQFDLIDHYVYADYRHGFHPDLTGTLRVSDEFTQVGGINFRNQVAVQPSLAWRSTQSNIVELSYSFFVAEYFFPTPAVFDRNGTTHSVAVTDFFQIPRMGLQLRAGYFHLWNNANGSDFDFQSDGLVAGVSAALLPRLTADAFYNRTWDRYANLNSLSGTTGFEFARRDDVDRVTVQLTWSVFDWMRAYVRYDYLNYDSNIRFFNFVQNSYSAGLAVFFQ